MRKKKPGFTLIEIIIVLALIVTVLEIASSMFITGNKVFSDSDIKSTLQIEGQTIQEKISDIGMQATGIKNLTVDPANPNQIDDLTISSYIYDKEGNPILHDFEIKNEDSGKVYKKGHKIYKLSIDDEVISSNVESVVLDSDSNSIEFNISLRKEGVYSNIEEPIDFRVAFRNK